MDGDFLACCRRTWSPTWRPRHRLTLEAFITTADGTPQLPVGESDLATLFPADTQLYLETRELGSVLAGALGTVVATMDEESAAEMAPIEDMLGVPLPELLDFVSDAGIGAGLTSDGLWLGIAAEVNDPEAAAGRDGTADEHRHRPRRDAEAGISVETEAVGDVDVTTITLPIDSAAMGLPLRHRQTLSVALTDSSLLLGTATS
jgi:hypothetical protein